jgi:DNA replication protein DnaC
MNQIESKFSQMRLKGMNRCWQALLETRRTHELSLTEGLEILLQAEEDERRNNRFERLKNGAKFRYQATLEELNYDPVRKLDKGLVTTLATCEFISKGESVVVTGATGCGKSFLASAMGHHACSHGYSVAYFNTQKLLMRIKMSRLDGTIMRFFDKLAKTSLLILDDFGMAHMDQKQQFDLMEIMEDRHGKTSTIIASQLSISAWYDVITESSIADAILDRLVHTSYRIELEGPSLRKKR